MIRIVNNFDTDVLAAYTIASRIDALAAMPAMNLASALSAFVGQNMGAGRIDRIKKGFRSTLLMSVVLSGMVIAGVYLWSEQIIGIFNKDPMVIKYGTEYLVIVSSFYIIFSVMFIIHGTLRGAGDTFIPMFISLFSLWIVRIPLAVFLSKHFGVTGIWWSIPIGWTMGLTGSYIYYLTGKWKTKGVTGIIPEDI
jgi:Na+-driven multidrug efflux pump